ncbi:MAG: hypothetical protein HPY53_11135 [Brevinematales bacterium]|nr:hypothetical protein [Brevinematales bacterium]
MKFSVALLFIIFSVTGAFAQSVQQKGVVVIPPGSFVEGILLTGGYAPIQGGQGIPVYIQLKGYAQLPNYRKVNMDGGIICAWALGDYTSSRVMIRVEALSYVDFQNQNRTIPLKGYVYQGGTLGVEGDVYSKEAEGFIKSLIISLLESTAKILQNNPALLGITENAALNAGTQIIQESTPTAFSKMADMYLELAQKYVPQVFLKNGVKVTIVFAEPFEFYTDSYIEK